MSIKYPKVYILCGISGSGKSTFIQNMFNGFEYEYINADRIRKELTGDEANQDKNSEVFKIVFSKFTKALVKANEIIIIDNTSPTFKDRKSYYDIIESLKFSIGNDCIVKLIVFIPNLDVAKARNKMRPRQVPDFVIEKQYKKFQMPNEWEKLNCDIIYIGA